MKNTILDQINLSEEEAVNFDKIFTVETIDIEHYKHWHKNIEADFKVSGSLVFFYNKKSPKKDFNMFTFDEQKNLVPVDVKTVVNLLNIVNPVDTENICHNLQLVLKPDAMRAVVKMLENKDKDKFLKAQKNKRLQEKVASFREDSGTTSSPNNSIG